MKSRRHPRDEIECVIRTRAIVGESPRWHDGEQKLYWIDIQKKQIHRYSPKTGRNETRNLPEVVTSLGFRKGGGLVLTLKKRFAFYDWEKKRLEKIALVEADQAGNRFNDGICDAQGRFWAGTMAAKNWEKPAGHLFRLDPDGKIKRVRSSLICSNGCGWSPDGRTFYHTESFRYTIWAFDFDLKTGALAHKRIFAKVDQNSGAFPDGLTVDAEGCVWSNHVGVGTLTRYDPKGKVERTIQFPVPRATDCVFGGEKLDTLYVTTARETMTPAQLRTFPLSGSVFAIRPGVKGLPTAFFGG
jgi:sugar lactone lactonase YvrE